MNKDDAAIAADNAAKLFNWIQRRRMSVPEGVEMMVMALAITIKQLVREQPDISVDEVTDTVCDMIKSTIGALREIPVQ